MNIYLFVYTQRVTLVCLFSAAKESSDKILLLFFTEAM